MTVLVSDVSSVRPFRAIPGPQGHWLKGNLADLKKQPVHLFAYQMAKDFGGMARFRVLHKNMLVLAQPDVVQSLLKARPEHIRRASKIETVFKEMGVHGVFSAEGADWLRQRQLMNPAFRPSQVKAFFPIIQNCTAALCKSLQEQRLGNEIQKSLMSYTVDITSALAFGIDLNTLERRDKEFQRHLNAIFPMLTFRMHAPFPYWKFFKLQRDRDLAQSLTYVRNAVAELIEQARQGLAKKRAQQADYAGENLLEAMLLAKAEDGQRFSEEELFANVITLLLAGEDTTANTLAWAIHFLADQPQLQDEVFEEITQFYPQDRPLEYADLDRFPLTFACAQESMRLVPVAPYLLLESYQDMAVEGYCIPKGTMIFALLAAKGLDDMAFSEAEQFIPKRWMSLTEQDKKRHANELMPFGFGARLCPGRQLSFVEMKVALIELIRHFRFSRTPGSHVTETLAFTVMPTDLKVDIQNR